MASANNANSWMNQILNYKNQWNTGNQNNDEAKKNQAAQNAAKYYDLLRQNGYSQAADNLQKSDYASAQKFVDNFQKMAGKTAFRPYMYNLGKKYGLTSSDIDKITSYNDATGEISFGGKNLGLPSSEVNGVSYWDSATLDKEFEDYVTRSGITRSKETAVNQENENLFKKYSQEYSDLKETNPFETDVGKAILGKYSLQGMQARDNAVASDAGSNGGNIDSFAAANAMRQQAALIGQGQQAVLDAHQQKLDHARNLLSDMGVHIDRVHAQNETELNNDVARKTAISEVTGYVPNEWVIKNDDVYNTYLNADGSFKKEREGDDVQALIDQAKARGDTDTANKLAVVRGRKILGNFSKYGQYADEGDISFMSPQETESRRQFNEQNATAKEVATGQNATTLAGKQIESDTNLALADKEAESALKQINARTQGEKELIAENAKYSGTKSSGYDAFNTLLSVFTTEDIGPRKFILEVLKPAYEGSEVITPEILETKIASNSAKYNIDVADAKIICNVFGVDSSWLNKYRDRTDADPGYNDNTPGKYSGMILK